MKLLHPNDLMDRLAQRLSPVPPVRLTATSWAAIALAAVAVGFHHAWIGGLMLAAGCLADGLGQAMAKRESVTQPPAMPLALLLVPFGFALGDPSRALAAMFLMLSLCLFTTQRVMAERPGIRWLHWLAALALLIACLLPDRFSLLCYMTGIACFVSVGRGFVRA